MCWPLSSRRPSRSTARARPPSVRAASNSVTCAPLRASSTAAAQPAQPPPTTATAGAGLPLVADIGLPRQPELAQRRERDALVQDVEVVARDLVEQGAVDRGHHQAGPLGASVFFRQQGQGLVVHAL